LTSKQVNEKLNMYIVKNELYKNTQKA